MRSRVLAPAVVLVTAGLLPGSLSAQGTIRGTVHDSLSRGGRVVGAVVELVGTTRRTMTDDRGRFEFEDVPAGQHVIRHHDDWLDSLALPPLTAVVRVRDDRVARADLATPGRRAYQRAVCGAEFDQAAAVLRGAVRTSDGAPAGGVFVGAVWSQAVVSRSGLGGEIVGSIDTTDAAGSYTLCGVPRGTTFVVRAGDDSVRTDVLTVGVAQAFVARRDLVIGDASKRVTVSGRVVTALGTPLANAVVAHSADAALSVRADADGRFRVTGLPMRSTEIIVRSVGYTPQYVVVEAGTTEVDLADVVLQPVAYGLDTVRVTAARTSGELEFLERRRVGWGEFLDEDELARLPALSANVLQTLGGGIRSSGGAQPRLMLRQLTRSGNCFPTFWMDGVRYGRPMDGFEEGAWLRQAKRIEIHRSPAVPAKYADHSDCGVVLIWTR